MLLLIIINTAIVCMYLTGFSLRMTCPLQKSSCPVDCYLQLYSVQTSYSL